MIALQFQKSTEPTGKQQVWIENSTIPTSKVNIEDSGGIERQKTFRHPFFTPRLR
jgi:hypothetical protein